MPSPHDLKPRKPIRLWPAVVGGLLLLARFVLPVVAPDASLVAMVSGLVGALIVVVWWLLFSRAPWLERLGAVVVVAAALFATSRLVHVSVAGGYMGLMLWVSSIFTVPLALVIWAVASRHWSPGLRRASMVVALVAGCGVWAVVRTDGTMGGESQLAWRWTQTAEERLLAQTANEPTPVAPAPAAPASDVAGGLQPAGQPAGLKPGGYGSTAPGASKPEAPDVPPVPEWSGFRGPLRDGVVRGVRVQTDWQKSPPVELWRRAIGPGWSSFAVQAGRIYTQEQRGDSEIVACYELSTGKPVWMHRDATRFYESNGGAGPRGTPTLGGGRVYTFGATGIVNVLDAGTGALIWSRNAAVEISAKTPEWGFSSSPLVVDDVVIVAVSGQLVAYDSATGQPRWTGKARGGSYSSPHLLTIDGVTHVMLLSGAGAVSVAPAEGTVLWEHASGGGSIVQPAVIANGDILTNAISMMGGEGVRRLAVKRGADGWTVEERWTSKGLKPYFNDFVVHKGHAYGFDGSILASIDLADGKRAWKGGRYGEGQLILLADQDVLLVLSEEGDLALVSATPDKFTELARFTAIEGKTWNHPVLVGNILLVRNGEEMAAFRLR